ncbi:MAG: hypothetical protein WC746_04625 [archaeon]|jgi:hypothetical protein
MNLEHVDERDNSKYIKLIGFGFLVWLVPFLVSFLFYTPQGVLVTSEAFFNSVMTVTGFIVAGTLLLNYMRLFTVDYLKESIQVGIVWFVISIVLDLVILVPMAKMNLVSYFANIGLGYLVIPMMALFAGYLLEEKVNHNKKIFSQVASTKK